MFVFVQIDHFKGDLQRMGRAQLSGLYHRGYLIGEDLRYLMGLGTDHHHRLDRIQ